jgi:DNA-binding transcriptional LysR family regulator
MHNWDDLRVFLALARHSTYQSASEYLGLDPTTIARRVARLETALKCTLLARGPAGHTLTATGQRLLEAANQVESANELVTNSVGTQATAGRVRISTSEGFGGSILSPALPSLLQQRPRVDIELVANPGFLSPAIREVDLAITLAPPKDKRLTVERLTDYRLALYASKEYLKRFDTPKATADLQHHTLVGYIDDLLYSNELRYLDEIHPNLEPSISSSSIRAQYEIVRAGSGIAVLPCFMTEGRGSNLERVLPQQVLITRSFWISFRRDSQQMTRIRLVRNWVRDTVVANRALLLPS